MVAALSLSACWPALSQDQPGQPQAQAGPHAECYCRAQGRMFAVGETACIRSAEGPRIAHCGMVLNNTSWRLTGQSCPES
jgi:hypothetical protein